MKEQDSSKKRKRKTVDGEAASNPINSMPSLSGQEQPIKVTPNIERVSDVISNMLQNTINKYSDVAEKQMKESREDFDVLQPIISEFLDDFILIGHTVDGQRVVMRYTSTPADMDKLTELCKKVLVRMMIQEQNGN